MKRWDALVGASICAFATWMVGWYIWLMTQSPSMVRQAIEALNVVFWFWGPFLILGFFAHGTVWFLRIWWRGRSIPNGGH